MNGTECASVLQGVGALVGALTANSGVMSLNLTNNRIGASGTVL